MLAYLQREASAFAAVILGSVVIGWVIGIICVSMFQCTSIAKAWDQNLRGTCINLKGSFIGNAVPNILTDIAILTLPVRVVWGLHATVTHRLLVIAVFLLGSLYVSLIPLEIRLSFKTQAMRYINNHLSEQRPLHRRLSLLNTLRIPTHRHPMDPREGLHLVSY